MAARKRTTQETLQLRAAIAKLRNRGYPQTDIAAKLGVTQQMVSYYAKSLEAEWRQSAQQDTELNIGRQLAQVAAVKQECWEQIDTDSKVKNPQTRKAGKRIQCEDMTENTFAGRTVRGKGVPDIRWLNTVLKCIDQESKLLGLGSAPMSTRAGFHTRSAEEPPVEAMDEDQRRMCVDELLHMAKKEGTMSDVEKNDATAKDGRATRETSSKGAHDEE